MDTGIVVGAYPADTGWYIQWQRAPDSGGSPDTGNAEIIAVLPPNIRRFVDRLPEDGDRRHYRWRHVRGSCSTEGAWSDWVDDIPGQLPEPLPPMPPLELTVVIEKDHQESDFDADDVTEGRLTLEVVEKTRKWDIDFFTRQGRGTSFTTGTSYTDQVDGDQPTQDVELIEKLNSWIRYEVTAAGGNVIVQSNIVAFDADEIAEVLAFAGYADGSGNVLTSGRADSDTAKVHITATTDGTEPNNPTAANADLTIPDDTAGTDARTWLNEDTTVDASEGQDVRMKARGENTAGVLAPTDQIVPFDFNVAGAGPNVVATENTTESTSGGNVVGTLTLTFIAGDSTNGPTYKVEFWHSTGGGGLGGAVDETETGKSQDNINQADHSVTLVDSHTAHIRYEITNEDTGDVVQTNTVAFDADDVAHVAIDSITIDPDTGDVEFSYVGDSDTDAIRFTAAKGSAPSEPTTGSSSFSGRTGTGVNSGVTLGLNEVAYIKVAGYNTNTGAIGPIAQDKKQREANPKEDQSKTLQLSMGDYTDAQPSANNADGTLIEGGALYDNVSSDSLEVNGFIPVNLAVGVTLTGWNMDFKQANHGSGDDVIAQLYEVPDDGGTMTLIDGLQPTGSSASFQNISATLNDTLALGKSYVVQVQVDSRTADKAAGIARIEIDYDAPRSVEHTL